MDDMSPPPPCPPPPAPFLIPPLIPLDFFFSQLSSPLESIYISDESNSSSTIGIYLLEPDASCPICRDHLTCSEYCRIGTLPCSHAYHSHCIFSWLRLHDTCPTCWVQIPSAFLAAVLPPPPSPSRPRSSILMPPLPPPPILGGPRVVPMSLPPPLAPPPPPPLPPPQVSRRKNQRERLPRQKHSVLSSVAPPPPPIVPRRACIPRSPPRQAHHLLLLLKVNRPLMPKKAPAHDFSVWKSWVQYIRLNP